MTKQKQKFVMDKLAGIEYYGISGSTQECVEAIMRLIQFDDEIKKAKILSCNNTHGFLLTINVGNTIAIKSGFTSGYHGEGPNGFSYILQLLEAYDVEIEEYEAKQNLIDRLDSSCLTQLDIKRLNRMKPIRPTRWTDYIFEKDWNKNKDGRTWKGFPIVLPYAIIDPRIADLAKSFWENPDEKLITGYRRLEDIFRSRCKIKEHGSKLLSKVFLNSPMLIWKNINGAEQTGRGTLFISAYQAFRNPRAHKEMDIELQDLVTEFLLLNHLFLLESKSSKSPNVNTDDKNNSENIKVV